MFSFSRVQNNMDVGNSKEKEAFPHDALLSGK